MRTGGLALVSLALAGSACSPALPGAGKERLPAPDFALSDADGKVAKLSDYKGKVVLLNFWATWCGPCKIEEPWFIEFERTYKPKGFAILGISIDEEGWAAVRPYIRERGLNYRILLGNEEVDRLYPGIEAWPTSFLIDRRGRIAWTHVGVAGRDVFDAQISSLLRE